MLYDTDINLDYVYADNVGMVLVLYDGISVASLP